MDMYNVQSQVKFYKTAGKCLHFKAVFKILFGGYATARKYEVFSSWALNVEKEFYYIYNRKETT